MTQPEPVYLAEVETLREMLKAEWERIEREDERIAKYGDDPDLLQRRADAERRIEALQTAIEALGGAL